LKIAFIADIHGNAVALDAVLADIEQRKADRIIVLGDLAYRGPEPKQAIDLIRGLQTDVIKGNADEWTVRGVLPGEVPDKAIAMMNKERDWTVERLNEEDLNYLRRLPTDIELELTDKVRVYAYHATPDSLFDVVLPDTDSIRLQSLMMNKVSSNLFICAHVHLPYVRYIGGKCLVNTGSVGLPFDGLPQASYAMVEAEQNRFRVTIERVSYDVNRVVQQYRNGNYPNQELMIQVVEKAMSPF
jgi:predicted phosphodiesterase